MKRQFGAFCLALWIMCPIAGIAQDSEKDDVVKNQTYGQVKIMGGVGIAQDFKMSQHSYWHFSAGWLGLIFDFSLGPGVDFNKYVGMYIRAHGIFLIGPMGGSALVPGMEPGIRLKLTDKLVVELGMVYVPGVEGDVVSLPGLPNVGVLVPLDWLDLFD